MTFIIIQSCNFETVASSSVYTTNSMRASFGRNWSETYVTVDPTALHQNQKGKKYLQKLASVQERHAW